MGYVGLPLAVEFSKKFPTIGYDIAKERVKNLNKGIDKTKEVESAQLLNAINKSLIISDNLDDIKGCNIYIITVPTPTDLNKRPDLKPLKVASKLVAKFLDKDKYCLSRCYR